ncbi:hypothetical protein C3K47_03835 [Solitalea longa]|uniref:Uncharacterized protein n=1 Tax=Solitalea longa TaxID=2079460 RepID=A0A2S5A7N2_9SPHI|nr:hypothetical protein C3K47_03835 [Solitalea longa]
MDTTTVEVFINNVDEYCISKVIIIKLNPNFSSINIFKSYRAVLFKIDTNIIGNSYRLMEGFKKMSKVRKES